MPDETDYSPLEVPLHRPLEGKTGSLVAFPRTREHHYDNLPLELTSFVGREQEVVKVNRLLAGQRLLTLSGPGGCGKTRLALAVAQDLVENFENSYVWWVDLAPLSDPKLVPGAVASAAGIHEVPDRSLTEILVEHLRSKNAFLVLDNCEHLVEGCAVLADTLLRACPDLKILATSREPLRIAGEATWLVPSLSLPDLHLPLALEVLAGYEAVRLFVERARAVDASFELTERNALSVARLCHSLDGIPLAIELAAARVKVLTVEQISEKLKDPLGLLTTGSRTATPRHKTLRATLEWSYELLNNQEGELLARLSVFAGGWTLEAAETVGAGGGIEDGGILDLLSSLVDKSLVVTEADGEGALRYRMLEPVRQYGRERLEASGELAQVRERHARYYLNLVEAAEPELIGVEQVAWLERLASEYANLRIALGWFLDEEGVVKPEERARLGLRLAAALGARFWGAHGPSEGRRWLEKGLAKSGAEPASLRAKALNEAGFIAIHQLDPRAVTMHEQALALSKDIRDESEQAISIYSLVYVAALLGDRTRLPALREEAQGLMEENLDRRTAGHLQLALGLISGHLERDHEHAALRLEKALALFREVEDLRACAICLTIVGITALGRGDARRADRALKEDLLLLQRLRDKIGIMVALLGMAGVSVLLGEPSRAACLFGASDALRKAIGYPVQPLKQVDYDHESYLATTRAKLGESAFEAAFSEGQTMSPEQAIEYALGQPPMLQEEERIHTPASEAVLLRIFGLGPARVVKNGRSLTSSADWIQKPRELLFFLLCHPPRTKEQIGLALWPDASTAQLRSSFHDTVYRLRRVLGGKEWIFFEKGRYAFNRSLSYSFDVEAFEENLSEARRVHLEAPEQAIWYLEEAVDLYGGDFLEDSADSEWAAVRQEELKREYGEALLFLGGLLFALHHYNEAADVYRKAIAHDRLLEEAHRELMRCYVASGERGRALRHYGELVALLDEQLGIPPAPETSALHKRLRAGEEA